MKELRKCVMTNFKNEKFAQEYDDLDQFEYDVISMIVLAVCHSHHDFWHSARVSFLEPPSRPEPKGDSPNLRLLLYL